MMQDMGACQCQGVCGQQTCRIFPSPPDFALNKARHLSAVVSPVSSRHLLSGVKSNGETKFRAIDDFSRSGINACTVATEKLRCDTIDIFYETLRALAEQFEVGATLVVTMAVTCAREPGRSRHVEVRCKECLQVDSRLPTASRVCYGGL